MKIKDGFMLRTVAGKNIVVAVGVAAMDFDGLISLNETGTFIWKLLEGGISYEAILQGFLDEYDVDEQTAKNDIDAFIKKAKEAELIEE